MCPVSVLSRRVSVTLGWTVTNLVKPSPGSANVSSRDLALLEGALAAVPCSRTFAFFALIAFCFASCAEPTFDPAAISKRTDRLVPLRRFACDVMPRLSEARLVVFARALANVNPAEVRATFNVLAMDEGVTNSELESEFNRLHISLLQYRSQQLCVRLGVHRHWMSCAQQAMWCKHGH